jgi:hypothetical protein
LRFSGVQGADAMGLARIEPDFDPDEVRQRGMAVGE